SSPLHAPNQAKFVTRSQRTPANKHGVQSCANWRRSASSPGVNVGVDEGLGLAELRLVFTRDLSARLSLPTPRHALEATALRQHSPEAVFQPEPLLHDELSQVVGKVSSGSHRRAGE